MNKVSGCDMAEIGTRMRAARAALGLSQEGLANAVGGSKRGIQNNEALKSVPGGEVICGLIALGINSNWLLSGAGPMLLADLQAPAAQASAIDTETLAYVIEAVEEALESRHKTLAAQRKAALIQLIYDYCMDTGRRETGTVDRFLKLVA